MPRDWKEIDTDEVLNFEGPQTNIIARYERIMQQRNIEATNLLKDKVIDLTDTIQSASQGIQDKYDSYSSSQSKQQNIIIALTIVIALSTAAYTFITWQSVSAMKESNNIQEQLLQIELVKQKEHNNSLESDGAKSRPAPQL